MFGKLITKFLEKHFIDIIVATGKILDFYLDVTIEPLPSELRGDVQPMLIRGYYSVRDHKLCIGYIHLPFNHIAILYFEQDKIPKRWINENE